MPGYTVDEKYAIARDFLVPHQLADHGLTPEQLKVDDEALRRMILEYTHEVGVRQWSQEVAALCVIARQK